MLKIDFINVGYGDSILLRSQSEGGENFCMLVDTGDCNEKNYLESDIRVKAADFLKSKGVEKIDILVISHLHQDHVGGLLKIAEQIQVKELWVNYMFNPEFAGKEIKSGENYSSGAKNLVTSINRYNNSVSALMKKGTSIKEIVEPFKISLSKSIVVDVICSDAKMIRRQREIIDNLYIDDDFEKNGCSLSELDSFINNTSIVMNISYGSSRILLSADAYTSYWDNREIPRCDILKFPHHGHKDGINKQLILAMNPSYIVISVSNTRLDDCPSRESVRILYECINPPRIMCTDAVDMPPFFEGTKQKTISFEIDEAGQIIKK